MIVPRDTEPKFGYYPDIVDDVFGRYFFIYNPGGYVPEIASMLALLFCLGMLSRYHPDIWIATIDANVRITELTNAFLSVVSRKFPNLILDQPTLSRSTATRHSRKPPRRASASPGRSVAREHFLQLRPSRPAAILHTHRPPFADTEPFRSCLHPGTRASTRSAGRSDRRSIRRTAIQPKVLWGEM